MPYYFLSNGSFFKAEYDLDDNEFKLIGSELHFYLQVFVQIALDCIYQIKSSIVLIILKNEVRDNI